MPESLFLEAIKNVSLGAALIIMVYAYVRRELQSGKSLDTLYEVIIKGQTAIAEALAQSCQRIIEAVAHNREMLAAYHDAESKQIAAHNESTAVAAREIHALYEAAGRPKLGGKG